MMKAAQVKVTKARGLRARAAKLCVRGNRLQQRMDKLYECAEELGSQPRKLLAQADELYAEANALYGNDLYRNVVRRQCLKCERSFGSTDFSNRLCADCNAQNATLPDPPGSPPKWNGEPMYQPRQTY
jgi:hypothetical protein